MRKISSIVIAVHCMIVLWMALFSSSNKTPKTHRLVVKTYTPQEKTQPPSQTQPVVAAVHKPVVESKPVIEKRPVPEKKVKASPQAPVKSAPTRPKPPIELLQKLEESLAKIEQKTPPAAVQKEKRRPQLSLPTLQIEHSLNEEEREIDYESALITTLYNQLNLPEFGEVKIKLTLQNNGAFVKMQVIRAQSLRNRRYLEEELPRLKMPHFIGSLANKKEETFILTFCNE